MEHDILSYAQFLKDRENFRKAGYKHGDDFNVYDTPTHKYFKILFYFGGRSIDESQESNASGLLVPTWHLINGTDYHNYNSAWAYLKMNDENERAEKLEQFINLLSNINTKSPWYFKSIGGIGDAMERKSVTDGKFDVSERKNLSIKCMPDAFDNRIATLLELYRDVTWSWTMKRQIIPDNLLKFDMAVYIFESPERYWHKGKYDIFGRESESIVLDSDNSPFKPSYKMIEFHDCEFNYNSIKSGWSDISNEEGFRPEYTIDISYGDAYEVSYNDVIMRTIGDVIATDTNYCVFEGSSNSDVKDIALKVNTPESIPQSDDVKMTNERDDRTYPHKGLLKNALNQVVGLGTTFVRDKLERAILGNIYTYSLTKIADQAKSALDGNVIATVQAASKYAKDAKNRNAEKGKPTGNIFGEPQPKQPNNLGDIYEDVEKNTDTPNGNIFGNASEKNTDTPNGNIFGDAPEKQVAQLGDIYDNDVPSKGKPNGNIFSESALSINERKAISKRPLGNIYKQSIANNL